MNEESITIRVLVTLQSSILMPTVCSVVFCSICSLLCSGIAIFKHERAELWELKMLISDWFIFNWSQGPVPRPCSHEGPAKYCGDQSLRLVPRIQTSLNSWDRFRGPKFSPCDRIFDENWPVHTMGLGRRDWSLRPVPATSPLVCGDLKSLFTILLLSKCEN